MLFIRLAILITTVMAVACGGGKSPSAPPMGGSGGSEEPGDPGTGGASGGKGGRATGGSGGSSLAKDAGTPADAKSTVEDASTAEPEDASLAPADGAAVIDGRTPMSVDGAPPPSYEGQIPIAYGPPVEPIVKMDCPEDPTQGWTEYQDSFNVQHPYNLPVNTRFSITGGVYNFWVFPNDFPHSPTAGGKNPRTEARYGGTADKATGGNFSTGMRLYSVDMLIEKNAVGSAIMQIHATDPAVPIGVRIMPSGDMVNNGTLTVVQGSSVPGGLVDRWFNYKASLDTATMQVKIYVNNCLKATYTADRGSGAFYFKNGVYFCKTSTNGCFSHYKNIHLYKK
jgi:hypothetical protein